MTKTTKTLTALAAAATIGLAAVAAPQPAEARNGGAIAAGIIGGLAVGALGGAAAANGPYYGYGPGHYAARPPYFGSRGVGSSQPTTRPQAGAGDARVGSAGAVREAN